MAEEVGADVVAFLQRGYVPGRSGELLLVAKPDNVVVRRGSWVPGDPPPLDTSHSTPWAHHQRVPIVLWGPPYVRSGVRSDAAVDVADLAPTFGALLGFDFPVPHGEVLEEGVRPTPETAPAAIVLVVFDGGGWNLLDRYPEAWPFVRRLIEEGTMFANATIGSSPSVTAAVHPTMGTGAYPQAHGIPDNTVRLPGGAVGDPWLDRTDPSLLRLDTLADAWDRANGNRAWAGLVATEPWHVGMLGKGAAAEGGDRDVAVLWNRRDRRFFTNPDFYELPSYLPGEEGLAERVRALDASDGTRDGRWLDNDLGDPAVLPGTPAFVEHQGEALRRIVDREPIGEDETTDLLFVELKSTDRGAHVWNLFGEEEPIVLRAQDDLVRDLVATLDRKVGPGRYVLALTADHGLTPLPEEVGGLRIHPDAVGERVEERFGPIVDAVTPASLFLDMGEVEERGIALADVARFVGDLRYEDGLPGGVDIGRIPAELRARRTFAAVLPGPWVARLSTDAIAALGPGVYPEGDLTSPVRGP